MMVKHNTRILDITHEDLVDLFSTGLEGSEWLSCEYDKELYKTLEVGQVEGDCFEDKIADTLLNGGNVYLFDDYAEGSIYGDKGELIEGDGDGTVMYTINLQDVTKGIENAFNGEFRCLDFDNTDMKKWLKECAEQFADNDRCDFDLTSADALLQVIMFNEVIYG